MEISSLRLPNVRHSTGKPKNDVLHPLYQNLISPVVLLVYLPELRLEIQVIVGSPAARNSTWPPEPENERDLPSFSSFESISGLPAEATAGIAARNRARSPSAKGVILLFMIKPSFLVSEKEKA